MTGDVDRNYDKFMARLTRSHEAVMFAASWLRGLGYCVEEPPEPRKCASFTEWKRYTDKGDLYAAKTGPRQRVEVKRRAFCFSCKADWPYPDVIVYAKPAWDRAEPKPVAILLFSDNLRCVAVIKASTFPLWRVRTATDRQYEDYTQDFYVASLDVPRFLSTV